MLIANYTNGRFLSLIITLTYFYLTVGIENIMRFDMITYKNKNSNFVKEFSKMYVKI